MNRWTWLLLGSALLLLTRCAGLGVEMNRLYGLDCRPEVLKQNGGYCASTMAGR